MITQYIKDNKTAEIINKIFDGDDTGRGILLNPGEQKKKARWEYIPFDSLAHILGKIIQGRSPVNVSKGAVRWLAWDIDEKYQAKDFCSKIWIYNRELIPFKSLSGRWHLFLFLEAWTPINEATKKAKSIQDDLIKLGLEVDKGHTLPNGYSIEKGKPGYWIYLPYSKTEAYSPYGQPLSVTQFIYRYKFRKHPLIAGSIGMTKGGRHKALFNAGLYLKYNDVDISLEDIGALMTDQIIDQKEIDHANDNENYDQEHLNKNYNNYLSDLCAGEIPFEPKQKQEKKKESLNPGAWRNGVKAEVIANEEFQPIDWLVENIIAPGLTIIAGKSKIGKSWLVLHLSYCIEKGEKFLGRNCAKGDVLHYSLEDGKRRIKTRWEKMCIQPDQTYYQFRDRKPKIPILTMGLEEEIEDWAKNIENPKMVVIDVYVKVKKTISKSLNAYENDNYNLQNLQTLAIKYNIGIVLVHHTKKGSENDVFDEINGSAGIQSNMDSMIVLASSRKAGKNSVFHCIPKDAEQLEFEVGMNDQMIWEDKGPVGTTSLTMLQERIIKAVKDLYNGNPAVGDGTMVKTKDVIEIIKTDDELTEKSGRKGKPFTKEDINKNLERLCEKGLILKSRRGEYEPTHY